MNGSNTSKARFGVFEFDPQSRELTKHGTRLKVQDQPLQILTALLEQPGQIVSREELQRRLWPDGTFVDFEQSLNKAVNKLREALGDSADYPVYIETLARRGYRFLAPLEREEAAPRRRSWILLVAAGVALAILLGTGLWPIDAPQVDNVVQLTNDTTDKGMPLIADGTRVLYSDGNDLWSVPASGGVARIVPLSFLSQPRAGLWLGSASPIRQQLLMVSFPDDYNEGQVWLAGMDGEAPHKVAELRTHCWAPHAVALAPNADRLAISLPNEVYIQTIATGERMQIHSMQREPPDVMWWHPSGRSVGFLDHPAERLKTRAWQINDDGTHLRRIVPEKEQAQSLGSWSPDGKRFYYFAPDPSERGGEIFVRSQPGFLGWMRKPVIAKLTASGQFQPGPTVDPVDPRRLYVPGAIFRGETLRYDRATRKWVSFLTGFSGDNIDWSPDGQWMAYLKFPSLELHKCRFDGFGDVLLAPGADAANPHWSPDGKRIAFAGRPAHTIDSYKLWLVSAGGGDAAPYRPEIESGWDAIWSSDGSRILLSQWGRTLAPGESSIKILHLETGKVEEVPGDEEISSTRWSPDGKQLCGQGKGGLYVRDLGKGKWRLLFRGPLMFNTWSGDGKFIYAVWYREEVIGRVEVATGRREEIVHVDFKRAGNLSPWVGWTKDWDPLVLRDFSSAQIYRIDLDR